MILVSACLAGEKCKYSGGDNLHPEIARLVKEGRAVMVCPEQLGGLPTPRCPSEIIAGRVVNTRGEDVSANFEEGARKARAVCRQHHCTAAVLKGLSPSCGCHGIYDGTFSHKVVAGKGVFAQLLEKEGVACMDENEYEEAHKHGLL